MLADREAWFCSMRSAAVPVPMMVLSLAWAIVEALHDNSFHIAARTLFATHYHELTVLGARLERSRECSGCGA